MLNRVGILLGFISFWLAAPEFIGKDRLTVYEKQLSKITEQIPKLFTFTSVIFLIVTASIVVIIIWRINPPFKDDVDLGNADAQLFLFHGRWSAVAVAGIVAFWASCYKKINPLFRHITLRLVSKLAKDNKQRQKTLFMGAFLFFVATVLQLLATCE